MGVFRSTDGIAYTRVGDVLVGTTSFTDEGLAADTKYWYKLSDDGGSTFSSVVTVVTQDCQSSGGISHTTGLNLPRTGGNDASHSFDEAMQKIEDQFTKDDSKTSDPCEACVDSEGKVVFDCGNDCQEFVVTVDQDVNSITFKNCKEEPKVHWQCPGDRSECGVCGWPAGSAMTGDECHQATFPGGKTMDSGPSSPRSKQGGNTPKSTGGGAGGTTCECVPTKPNRLSIKCCTAECSMACSGAKSLSIKVCGGTGPYTISGTGSVGIKRNNGTSVGSNTIRAGEQINITPPTNSGSGVAGTAYCLIKLGCDALGGFTYVNTQFGCNDQVLAACNPPSAAGPLLCGVTSHSGVATDPLCAEPATFSSTCTGSGRTLHGLVQCAQCDPTAGGVSVDGRSAAMIAANCSPCGVSSAAQVITVTDSLGNSTTKVLSA